MSVRKLGEFRPSRVNAHIPTPDNVVVKLYWDTEWEVFRVEAVVGARVSEGVKLGKVLNAEPGQTYLALTGGRVVARYETSDAHDAELTALSMLTSTLTGLREGRHMPSLCH